jgi:uncharacterized membrane-anchored protein
VLVLTAVAGTSQLAGVEKGTRDVMGFVDFNPGNRYADFVEGDKVAAYGVGALIAGKVAAKAGFFKLLLAGALAMKKVLAVAAVALVALLRRVLGRKEPSAG